MEVTDELKQIITYLKEKNGDFELAGFMTPKCPDNANISERLFFLNSEFGEGKEEVIDYYSDVDRVLKLNNGSDTDTPTFMQNGIQDASKSGSRAKTQTVRKDKNCSPFHVRNIQATIMMPRRDHTDDVMGAALKYSDKILELVFKEFWDTFENMPVASV